MFMYIWRYKNNICDDILISSDGEYLTGYGGGINNKIKLLQLEGHDISRFYVGE